MIIHRSKSRISLAAKNYFHVVLGVLRGSISQWNFLYPFLIFHSLCRRHASPHYCMWLGGVQRGWVDLHMNDAMSRYLYYVAMSCSRGGPTHPGCRSAQFCCRPTGQGPGLVPVR